MEAWSERVRLWICVCVVCCLWPFHIFYPRVWQKVFGCVIGSAGFVGSTNALRVLLRMGPVDARDTMLEATPLMLVAWRGTVEAARLLLEHGADVNAKDKFGGTALMMASEEGHLDMMEWLLENGAEVNVHDQVGRTAFINAATRGHIPAMQLLIEAGADPNAQMRSTGDALTMAVGMRHEAAAIWLAQRKIGKLERALEFARYKGYIQLHDRVRTAFSEERH